MDSVVYLLGAGPSGEDLLTLRAYRLLSSADLIIYDALVAENIHHLFPHRAKLIYVGKRAGQHALSQESINKLLIDMAQSGKYRKIVRLKGGDPFVFGRGGEEMIALKDAGIQFEIVPGVTSGLAAPAYLGVPVTHRGLSRSVSLITAFSQSGSFSDLDWDAYVRLGGTLVFYMGMRIVPQIVQGLIGAGMPRASLAGIISQGTRPNQSFVVDRLDSFIEGAYDYDSLAPGLFVVGEVLEFAGKYEWYNPSPLAGKTVLITRSEGQSSDLSELFRLEGATPKVLPTFEIEYCSSPDTSFIDRDWSETILALSSPNAVDAFFSYLRDLGKDSRYLSNFKGISVVGPSTQKALLAYGVSADWIAEIHTSEGMAECIAAQSMAKSVLHPTSNLVRPAFEDALSCYGIDVENIVVYKNKPVAYKKEDLERLLTEELEWVTFCSSSAVTNFRDLLKMYGLEHLLSGIKMASIGPITTQTMLAYGYKPTAQASSPGLSNLITAMKESYCSK